MGLTRLAGTGRALRRAPAKRSRNFVGPLCRSGHSNKRVIGFSTHTGGFYDVDWTPNEQVVSVDGGLNALIVRTSSRTLVLKSQSTSWTEVR